MNTGGEAAGIGNVLSICDIFLVNLRQTIDVVVVTFDAEILSQIDDLDVSRDAVFLEESLALAVSKAEEDYIDLVKGHLVGKLQICLANQTFMDI